MIYVSVEDVDATVERAVKRGGKLVVPVETHFWETGLAGFRTPPDTCGTIATRVDETTENQRRERWSTILSEDTSGRVLTNETTLMSDRSAQLHRRSWVPTSVFVGIVYAIVGIVFAVPFTHVKAWRLAAWAISIMAYAAHIGYERFVLQNSPGSASLHVALGVALGAFGLAVGANIHSISSGSTGQHRHLLLLALAIWPVITAVPAFVVAFAANLVLRRVLGKVQDR